jgi:hypothetical protein
LFTRRSADNDDENFGFQPGLGINGLPGFSGEKLSLATGGLNDL